MAETSFHSVGRIDFERTNNWQELVKEILIQLQYEMASFEMTSLEVDVVETGDGRVYKWEAEGKIN